MLPVAWRATRAHPPVCELSWRPCTSPCDAGGHQSVMEGLHQLAELVAQGGGRISVMPGGGVDAENAATVARVTGGWGAPWWGVVCVDALVMAVGGWGRGVVWRKGRDAFK